MMKTNKSHMAESGEKSVEPHLRTEMLLRRDLIL